ncbi:nuclear receptor subfamily 1 group D member 2-like isoform X2 [Saccostrea cucullata]|uniref:nuclear receptor subfamily 1 group D member 2-like isoform X2 n=1 Tax=Saccostrea cuccullata TaxID=36930 RepID=UPI002ED436CE
MIVESIPVFESDNDFRNKEGRMEDSFSQDSTEFIPNDSHDFMVSDTYCFSQDLEMGVAEFGISEPSGDELLGLEMGLSEFIISDYQISEEIDPGSFSGASFGENLTATVGQSLKLSGGFSEELHEDVQMQSELNFVGTQVEERRDCVEENKGFGLDLPDCLEPETENETGTSENKTSLPKMMEFVEFLVDMEGIKDFKTASTMTDIIMEEIVDNALAVSDSSNSASSPSTGERLHCPDTPCGQDSNYSAKNSSIKAVVSKAKDPGPKSTFLPPCRVCGDNASGFHYGANTCEACKGFFRRSIVKVQQNKESYKCAGKGSGCNLGPGKRNPCAACRYARCLEVGMSINAIKTGRYTYEKRTKDTVEVRNMKAVESPSHLETYISDSEVDQIIQALKDVLLKNCPQAYKIFDRETNLHRQWQIYNDYKAKVEIFGSMSVIPKDVWDEFYKETGIDLDNRQELMKEMACRMEYGLTMMVDFVRAIPGFADLSVSDQTELIKASHFEFFYLMNHKTINPELRVISGMLGMHQSDMEKIAEKEMVDTLFQFSASFTNLDLCFDEVLLLRGISVTFADRCQLEEPKAVERIQWKLINAFRVLAKRKNFKPEQRLWHIMDRLTALRTMTEISKELDKQKCSWPVMKDHPLVLDILQS